MEASEAGDTKRFEDWILKLYSPECWPEWIPYQEELAANGLEKRAARISSVRAYHINKKKFRLEKRKRSTSKYHCSASRMTDQSAD
jgi:hypothetical protein